MRVNDEADSFINSVQYRCTGTAGDVCPTELPFFSTNAEFLRGGTDIGEVFRDIGKRVGRPDLQKQGETLLQEMVCTNSSPKIYYGCPIVACVLSLHCIPRTGRVRGRSYDGMETHPSSRR